MVARLENTIAPGRRASDFASPDLKAGDGDLLLITKPALLDAHDNQIRLIAQPYDNDTESSPYKLGGIYISRGGPSRIGRHRVPGAEWCPAYQR